MRSPQQILKLLDQYDLRPALRTHSLTVQVATVGDVRHLPGPDCTTRWLGARTARYETVPLLDYLTAPAAHRCADCSPGLARTLRTSSGAEHRLTRLLLALAAANNLTRAANSEVVAKIAAADKRLATTLRDARNWPLDAGTTALLERVCADALGSIGDLHGQCDAVLATVRGELVPERMRAHVQLDETPCLIVLDPVPALHGTAHEVVLCTSLLGPDRTGVLHAPAYVRDYLARWVVGASPFVYLDAAPCPSELAPVAAHLWNPAGGPLSAVATAVSTARDISIEVPG